MPQRPRTFMPTPSHLRISTHSWHGCARAHARRIHRAGDHVGASKRAPVSEHSAASRAHSGRKDRKAIPHPLVEDDHLTGSRGKSEAISSFSVFGGVCHKHLVLDRIDK